MDARQLDRLSFQDAMLASFDRPEFPYNCGSVGIYEGRVPFDAYLAHIEQRIGRAPRYRQRLVSAPLSLEHPAWQDDPAFDIRNHVENVELPWPGNDEQLARFAGEFFAEPLKRDRPLWEIRLVTGLRGGRSAHVAKVHHCLVDGVGGVELLAATLDLDPHPLHSAEDPHPVPAEPLPGRTERLIDAIFDRAESQIRLAETVTLAAIDPRGAAFALRSITTSLKAAIPHFGWASNRTPWNTSLTRPSRLDWQSFPFAEVHDVGSRLGGTVNDTVLTILAGALHRYLTFHGYETRGRVIRVLIPVNVRTAEEAHVLGNRVSFMLAGLPMDISDPVARFRAIHSEIATLKASDQAGGVEQLFRTIGRATPPAVQRLLGSTLTFPNFLSDIVCTNVPGPRVPLYCMGHRMIDHYPWVPLGWRMGLGVAVMSYNDGLYFSLTADRSVLADLDRLAGFLRESFNELRAAEAVEAPLRAALDEEPAADKVPVGALRT